MCWLNNLYLHLFIYLFLLVMLLQMQKWRKWWIKQYDRNSNLQINEVGVCSYKIILVLQLIQEISER